MKNSEQFELVSAGSPTRPMFSVVELLMRNREFLNIFDRKPNRSNQKINSNGTR